MVSAPWPAAGSGRCPESCASPPRGLVLLLHGPEDQEKVPDVDSHLHAVSVVFAVVLGLRDRDGLRSAGCSGWLIGISMRCCICGGGPCLLGWCERGDSSPHGLLRQALSLVRLPIPPLSRGVEGTNVLGHSCPLRTTELYRVSSAGRWFASLPSSLQRQSEEPTALGWLCIKTCCSELVRRRGLEPLCLAALAPQLVRLPISPPPHGACAPFNRGRSSVQSERQYNIHGAPARGVVRRAATGIPRFCSAPLRLRRALCRNAGASSTNRNREVL